MKIMQWYRRGIGYEPEIRTDLGYDFEGNSIDCDEMISWCIEHFGDKRTSLDDDYRWGSHISGTSTSSGWIHGCVHFKYEEDTMAFKLRWV